MKNYNYIDCHTHTTTPTHNVLAVVNQYPWQFCSTLARYSIGIHPWYIKNERTTSDIQKIKEILNFKNCVALGECGLDKRIETPLSLQIDIFKKQLAIVQKTEKPIILHCVAAYQEIIAIKKEMKINNPLIIHGFSKNKQVAKSLLNNGFFLSFGNQVISNPKLHEVINFVPLSKIFLETDTANTTISTIYSKVSTIKDINLQNLQQQITANYLQIFNY